VSKKTGGPSRIQPEFHERIWGREDLAPLFPGSPAGKRIGEVWFHTPGTLLVKFLFTSERLSVQVHPDDAYAERHHGSLGKTEAWYVVDAQPPGEVAVGFRQTLTRERLKEVAQTGEIEQLLDWRRVKPGDVIFVPAGTVHAIGAGLTLCEIQENSDITYRLYDYGRPRELHLEHGVLVAELGPHRAEAQRRQLEEWREELLVCPYFRIERLQPRGSLRFDAGCPFYRILICIRGSGRIVNESFCAGEAWLLAADQEEFVLEGAGSEWILTYTAQERVEGIREV